MNARLTIFLAACALLAAAAPARAATPASGTLPAPGSSVAWTGESAGFGPNLAAVVGVIACVEPFCDSYELELGAPGRLVVESAADDGATLSDTYVTKPDGTTTPLARGDETGPARVVIPDAEAGTYTVQTFLNAVVTPRPYHASATLGEAGSGGGEPGGGIVVPTTAPSDADTIVCLIDTGINATHKEFAPDQVVAWWDFVDTSEAPGTGDYYDPRKLPLDEHGHGTATASMAAGLNADPAKTASFAPGTRLAIARVGDAAGTISGDIAAAFDWCRTEARADVINMSIGSIVPVPGAPLLFFDEYEAIAAARAAGILVTLSNGNGAARTGFVPSSGANSSYSSSMDSLNVGPSDVLDGPNSTDAEVAAQYSVTAPVHTDDESYTGTGGTSFSAPLVAGFAAALIDEARTVGRALDPEYLETLIKYSARDTLLPPSWEGYGVIDPEQLPGAAGHARAGTVPTRPSPDVNGLYVEEVSNRMRELNNGVISFRSPASKRKYRSLSPQRRAAIRRTVARRQRAAIKRQLKRSRSAPAARSIRLPL